LVARNSSGGKRGNLSRYFIFLKQAGIAREMENTQQWSSDRRRWLAVQVKLKTRGDTLVVQMRGELDHHAATGLRTEIDARLAEDKIKNVLFNFRDVDFMDSSGFGMVLGRYKAAREKGGKVLACSLRPPVRRVFELGGLTTRIPVFGTEQEAQAFLWGGEHG